MREGRAGAPESGSMRTRHSTVSNRAIQERFLRVSLALGSFCRIAGFGFVLPKPTFRPPKAILAWTLFVHTARPACLLELGSLCQKQQTLVDGQIGFVLHF
jgi:hypothetical protein